MFFSVVAKPQTWRNIGYLLLAFPLGIFYFIFLVTGLSLGFGLLVIWVGVPLLVGVLAASYGMGEFERNVTNLLFDQETPPSYRLSTPEGFWAKVKALLISSETWKRVGYLFLEFPFGIIGFTLVTTTAATFALVATPLFYTQSWWATAADWPADFWVVDTLWEAFIVAVGALVVGFVFLQLMNGVAWLWAGFARAMLGPTHRATVTVDSPVLPEEAVPLRETRP